MPITAATKKSMHDAAAVILAGAQGLLAQVDAIVVDEAPAWKVGDVAIAITNPFQLYTPLHTAAGLPRPNYNSDQNVLAVSGDGQWLKVFASPEYWVKAADVKHK